MILLQLGFSALSLWFGLMGSGLWWVDAANFWGSGFTASGAMACWLIKSSL